MRRYPLRETGRIRQRLTRYVVAVLAIAVLVVPATPVLAAELDEDLNYKDKVTYEERKAAGQRFLEAYLEEKQQVGAAAVGDDHILDPDSGLYVPHYFGPYPNYALSPLPAVTRDVAGEVTSLTGGIRKFMNSLPRLGVANDLDQFLPVAVADQDTFPGSDYYEIAVVEVEQKMHEDLPPTKLRQYVQLSTDVVPGDEVLLVDADGNNIMMPDGSQAYGVTAPQYLGPVIVAQKDTPVRVRFYNLLPIGADGDLFIPTDTTQMGAGMGAVMDMFTNEPINYTQNRATLHLHGGRTPWISDGTPHQWITPAGEDTPYPQGVSVYDVPDMWFDASGDIVPEAPGASSDPGDGSMTFFYTNQQSARFMFYHDHSFGITRLNVYAGGAAGYVIRDDVEQDLIDRGIIPTDEIPLIIQDKTFVPDPTIPFSNIFGDWESQDAFYDPTWDYERWGDYGDLWYPHVYMSVQNPYDISGSNAFGRWHYGPWFWPPTIDTIKYHPIPNPYADPGNPGYSPLEPPLIPGTPTNSAGMESFFDTPVVNGTVYPYLEVDPKAYRFRILNAANDRFWNLQLHVADPDVVTFDGRSNTEVRMVPAEGSSMLPDGWPTDGREGGVPDPLLIGPEMIQFGTEGGFLPEPVVLPNQPIVWNLDPTTFNVGNVESGNLILGPAERADVVVDFSDYAGQTLILYNDAPAPFPALAPQYDYYTGAPDMSDTGSAPGTEPGFGPNTRTIMQIRVADIAPAEGYDLAALNDEFVPDGTGEFEPGQGVFVRGQDEIIVGQSAYDAVYDTSFPTESPYWGYSNIQDNDLSFQTVAGDFVDDFPMQPKAIQDEMGEAFDDYGRMSGFLGLELPRTQAGAANFVLSGFTDPPVDLIPLGPGYDDSQIWKITHNGVDTHPIHFHLYDVQVLNRVGWDGQIRTPDANELGWKDTVRISPLEDTIVALKPVVPTFPFDVPNSIRLLDPTQPEGAVLNSSTDVELTGLGLMSFAPNGEPIDITNHYVNFGWEYVWHCHILSHEEMDMMHVQMVAVPPAAPSNVTAGGMSGPFRIVLNWTNPALNATGFRIQRATDSGFTTDLITMDVDLVAEYVDEDVSVGQSYYYRVAAINLVGDTWDYSDPEINEGAVFPTATMVSPYTVAEWIGMQVTGNSIVIASGDVTPSIADHTDFGIANISEDESVVRTFTIHNTSLDGDLTLDGDPVVELTGDTGDFTVTALPASSVAALDTTTFEITFDPTSTGVKTATVSIANNDALRDPYTFAIQGSTLVPVSFNLEPGWNMVSVPLILDPGTDSPAQVFPGAVVVYAWDATQKAYYTPLTIEPERGYWVAVTEVTPITVYGSPATAWTDTMSTGWNLIGSVYGDPVAVADLGDVPPGALATNSIYWWNPVSRAYDTATHIVVGQGYWAAATENCMLTVAQP